MGPKNKLKLSRILLASAILLIVAFQSYWLNKLYREEWLSLKKDTNGILRDVVYDIQATRYNDIQLTRIKRDSTFNRKKPVGDLFAMNVVNDLRKKTAAIKKTSGPSKEDSVRDFEKKILKSLNLPDSPYTSSSAHIQVRSDGLPPELVQELAKRQVVKLPPMMDSALLRRMQSGMKVMVSFNRPHDSASGTGTRMVAPNMGFIAGASGGVPRFYVNKRSSPSGKETFTVKATSISPEKEIYEMLLDARGLDDSLSVAHVDSTYRKELNKAGIKLDFYIKKGKGDSLHWKDTLSNAKLVTSPRGIGLSQKFWYQDVFVNPTTFLLKKLSLQILFSLFLVAFTSVTFLFLYRNLVAQRKLTEMKNDFISNITHELKTPLATVSVAVEALRNFGAIQNPERTKEYLDISASELQRLSLLVDKVLKLSLFENRELELRKEVFDLKQLTEEVLNTMKLQFDTHHAKVEFSVEGNYFTVTADRLHITSVIFNLLDNALKYSNANPEINVRLQHKTETIVLEVEDKGIGIASDFRSKIFDKFFRVPTGNHHNIKGYGLGLSYVAHVIKRHNGTISVDSEPGKGSTFTIKLPVT
ncbi:MAG: histidine kinase [Sediminibacterium sp.]|nr:histidine kinase [Sediminibacterium sp.]